MKTWQIALLGLASLAVAGCQTDPNNALLERELFQKENEIYQLRDQLEDCRAELQSLRCQKPPRSTPPAAATERGPAATPSTPSSTPPAPEEEKEPSIVLPKQPEPEGKVPERFQVPTQPGNSPPPANSPSPSDSTAPPWKPSTQVSPVDSSRVAAITLNQSLTAGYSTAGSPGQEGVIVVVEPRDTRGRLLDAPADLQVVALDPALSGAEARVARWEITAGEASARLGDAAQRGIHLTLPWPDRPPTHNRLRLFVRYVTSDGRKLQAEGLVEVALPGDRSAGWTPARHRAAEPSSEAAAPDVRLPEGPAPRTANASSDAGPPRPVWSPDRS